MVHCLRACFLRYIITTNWIMCFQEKIELSSMSQRPGLSSTKIQEISP